MAWKSGGGPADGEQESCSMYERAQGRLVEGWSVQPRSRQAAAYCDSSGVCLPASQDREPTASDDSRAVHATA